MKFYYEDNEEATWGTNKWSMPVKHIIAVLEKQGEQKPAWSEEDISKIDTIIGYIASSAGEKLGVLLPCINWLKSLKDSVQPQNKWKPTEEQLKALYDSIPENVTEISEREMLLNELYKDLKYKL
jgi:hypothetical protein